MEGYFLSWVGNANCMLYESSHVGYTPHCNGKWNGTLLGIDPGFWRAK